jgi:nitrite reductase/ring-hydroxylating ferredoxin subunit
MAELQRVICRAEELIDGGLAVRFTIPVGEPAQEVACFAIAYDGKVYGYVNSCPHRGTELDWQAGEVFEETGLYLMCATHGALFEPDSGLCVGGPCQGAKLRALVVKVLGSDVVLDGHGVDFGKDKREP